jgi:hypothetical protein
LANGDFVVAWTTNSIAGGDGSGLAVKAQILDRNLPPIAQDFDLYTLAGQTLTFDNRFFPIDDPDPDYMEFPRLERFPHELNRRGFPLRRRCDSDFLLVAGGQHGWHERFHRIFGTGLSQRLMAG